MQIIKTRDYQLFKLLKGNRPISQAQVGKIGRSIAAYPELIDYNPIMVNDQMEIIDGQHRFEALKQLEWAIPYVQVKNAAVEAPQVLNATQFNWKPIDYAKFFADYGNDDYATYLDIKANYPKIRHNTLMSLFEGSRGTGSISVTRFKRGSFKINNEDWPTELEQLVEFKDVVPYNTYVRRDFTVALLIFMRHPNYSQSQMLDNIEKYGGKYLKGASGVNEYLQALERTYNEYLRVTNDKVHFLFDVNNKAKAAL